MLTLRYTYAACFPTYMMRRHAADYYDDAPAADDTLLGYSPD